MEEAERHESEKARLLLEAASLRAEQAWLEEYAAKEAEEIETLAASAALMESTRASFEEPARHGLRGLTQRALAHAQRDADRGGRREWQLDCAERLGARAAEGRLRAEVSSSARKVPRTPTTIFNNFQEFRNSKEMRMQKSGKQLLETLRFAPQPFLKSVGFRHFRSVLQVGHERAAEVDRRVRETGAQNEAQAAARSATRLFYGSVPVGSKSVATDN